MKSSILTAIATLTALTVFSAAAPLYAQRNLTDIPDPDPEIERRSFQVADGFEVNLFAADPLLAKPIQMNFDATGRLWLVCSEVYPQIAPGQVANDKVIVLEDRDGDGRADKTTVFADGLLIPTGIEPGDGGAYVANSTELLHFQDTDGDGRADRRRVVLSGFGTEDTHHILHTLRWGYDGMLYFNQSIYIHSHVETPHGVRRLGGGGIWQFRPETMQLEVFLRGLINPWGHHFDRWGQSFATDGAGGEGINYVLPGGEYASIPNPARYVQGLNPGSPKYCGAEIVSGRHLPDDWRDNILTNDFRGNRVCRFVLSEDGAGFAAREQTELIKTPHVAFRPIDIKMGPDGAIYIADWYNPIIQHGEVDFRDPRRDHSRGRIWRVTARGRPALARPKLVGAPTEALLEALKSPEDWTRHHAKRVLKERGSEVVPALSAWVKRLDPQDPDVEHHRLEALWTYQALDVVEPELLAALLRARDYRVRAAATRVVPHWQARLPDALGMLATQVADDHPRVRLEAVRALASLSSVRSAEVALRALDRPTDRFLDYALWLTMRELAPHWLTAAQAGRFDAGGDARHLVFALGAVGSPAVVGPLREALRAGKVAQEQEERVLGLIAALGEPKDLAEIFDMAVAADQAPAARRVHLLSALSLAARQRKVRPEGDLTRLGRLLEGDDDALRAEAARVAGVWKLEPLRARLAELARAGETSEVLRAAAIDALVQLGGAPSRELLEQLASARSAPRARLLSAAGLASLDLKAGAARAVEVLSGDLAGTDPSSLFTRFLERQGGPAALAVAMSGRTLPAEVAQVGLRVTRASGRDELALIDALTKSGGLSAVPVALTPHEREQLVADVARLGDPARGEVVFRRKDLSCLKCHAIAGAGGQVGPDLISIGASAQVDYLLDSVFEPNKAVKENYHALSVASDDGRVVTGLKVRQSDTELFLRDADDREVAIPLSSIEEQKPAGSLMPAGLADSLTRGELIDLVRFLSELGKVGGSYTIGQARVIRRWQVADLDPFAGQVLHLDGLEGDAGARCRVRWEPAYSQVSGSLPRDEIPPVKLGKSNRSLGIARGQVDISTAGSVKLLLNSTADLSLWLDEARVEPRDEMVVDLSAGRHTLTFAIDLARRRAGLRCEIEEIPGSTARAQIVGGK